MRDDFEDDEPETGGGAPDPKELVLWALARSRWIVVALVGLGALGGLAKGIASPNTYSSHAKLLLRIGERERMTTETIIGGVAAAETRPTIETEMHLLRDRRNFERVVRELGPEWILEPEDPTRWDDENTAPHVRWLHRMQARMWRTGVPGTGGEPPDELFRAATRVLMANTVLFVEYGSNVISVIHTSTSPQKAQRITEALVESFIARHREQFSALPILEGQRDELTAQQNRWEEARRTFASHVEECRLFDIAEQGPALLAEQAELRQSVRDLRAQRAVLSEQLSELQQRLESTPERIEVALYPDLLENPVFADLVEQRRTLTSRRLQVLRATLSPSERQRQLDEIDAQIRRIDEEMAKTPPSIATSSEIREMRDNPQRAALEARIADLRFEQRGVAARMLELEDSLRALDEQVDTLRQCTDLHQIFDMQINRQLQSYQELSSRFARLEAIARIEMGGDTNLSELQLPSLPAEKEGPRRLRLLIFGMAGGGLIGLLLAIARQLLDPHLRYPTSVERVLGVRLIGVIPEVRGLRAADNSRGGEGPGA